jgi:hypothetical protein
MNEFFYSQIDLYDCDEKFLNRTFHWKLCKIPEIGQVVVFRNETSPNLVGTVQNTAMIFDPKTGEAFDHLILVKLLPNESGQFLE